MLASLFRKHIFLPQDHGSWVFIASPLFVGLFAGKQFTFASFTLTVAMLMAFLIRQPLTIAVKAYSGRRAKDDLPAARFWIVLYSAILLLAAIGLALKGFVFILYLAIPGAPVFVWHLWLVSRREERRQINVEIVATGVLALAAPAAYWVGSGHYVPTGWWLWILCWMQSAASIVYAYLRLEQREQAESAALSDQSKGQTRRVQWKMGFRATLYTSFNLASSLSLSLLAVLPSLIFIPFLLQWSETLWGITHPATGWKPIRIGMRQLIVSMLWTVSFILLWR
ncbi:MAG: YwiC-like family protein [Chloroflexota bacterium]